MRETEHHEKLAKAIEAMIAGQASRRAVFFLRTALEILDPDMGMGGETALLTVEHEQGQYAEQLQATDPETAKLCGWARDLAIEAHEDWCRAMGVVRVVRRKRAAA